MTGQSKRFSVRWICVLLGILMLFAVALSACNGGNTEEPGGNTEEPGGNTEEPGGNIEEPDVPFAPTYRTDYAPTLFDGGSVSYEVTELGDGVTMVKNTVTKSNDTVSAVYAIEVDLSEADIRAGTKNNVAAGFAWEKSVPYAQAQAWESATGGHVYASINADFFGSTCVNAFVKDGVIVKAGHNDAGVYDYLDLNSDVPASAPMLFGIKGTSAQIAPIVSYEGDITSAEVKRGVITAKLSYGALSVGGGEVSVAENTAPSADRACFLTTGSLSVSMGVAIKVDVSQGYSEMKVLEKVQISKATELTAVQGDYAYIVTGLAYAGAYGLIGKVSAGDTVSLPVTSPDGLWDGYETILGCRQALVVDGAVADTVTLENTNGAQSRDVPRTAIGIKADGTVVLFAVESMYYGKKDSEGDLHGMNLPELAQFAYFYGCEQAANFDGGGSTQLVVRGAEETEARVVVRSSDTASTELLNTRSVMNGLLITTRED